MKTKKAKKVPLRTKYEATLAPSDGWMGVFGQCMVGMGKGYFQFGNGTGKYVKLLVEIPNEKEQSRLKAEALEAKRQAEIKRHTEELGKLLK